MSATDPDLNPEHIRATDFPSGQFKSHGDFDMVATDRVLRTKASGPFNEEMAIAADKARRLVFARYANGSPFAVITTVRDSVMCPPATLALTGRLLKGLVTDGLPLPVAVAWVIPDEVEGKSVMAPLYARAFADAGIPFRVLDASAEAEHWVAEVFARTLPGS